MRFYMIKAILLILLICLALSVSNNQQPNAINQYVSLQATANNLTLSQYFSLGIIDHPEWYAFVMIQADEIYAFMKFDVRLKTVQKVSGQQSHSKVQCFNDHNDMHLCYLAFDKIDTSKQHLKIELIFQEAVQLKLKVEINVVKNMNMSSQLTLKRSQSNFTNIIRMDIRQYKEKFYFMTFYLKEDVIIDQYRSTRQFVVSTELTPPDLFKFGGFSYSLWDLIDGVVFSYTYLQQIEYLTFVFGITDQNTYTFTHQVHKNHESLQLTPYLLHYQILDKTRDYHIKLPALASPTEYNLLRIKFYHNSNNCKVTNIRANNISISQTELSRILNDTDIVTFDYITYVWLNSTIHDLSFTLQALSPVIYTIQMVHINTSRLALDQKLLWNDYLTKNETQYVYLTIDTKSATEDENFLIYFYANNSNYNLKFRSCVKESVEKCDQIMKDTNQTLRQIGAPEIKGNRFTGTQTWSYYKFLKMKLTKIELSSKNGYRAIVIVQVTSNIPSLYYGVYWFHSNAILPLNADELTKGHLGTQQLQVYSFTVLDAAKITFARVHYLYTSQLKIIGTTEYVQPQKLQIYYRNSPNLIQPFDSSLTFTNLQSLKTYYVYVYSDTANEFYQMTLTYGYNLDGDENHTITYLTVGPDSRNELVLRQGEILFVQLRLDNQTSLLELQTNSPLKFCFFETKIRPTSHKDLTSAKYCKTFNIYDGEWMRSSDASSQYVGIENENKSPSKVTLVTSTQYRNCRFSAFGRTMYIIVNPNKNYTNDKDNYCLLYSITHKVELQIVVDIDNPKLKGIALPQIKIGKTEKLVMTTKKMIISAQDLDAYCQQEYEGCFLQITITKDQQHSVHQFIIPVIVSQTDKPVMLIEGIAHHTTMISKDVKYFKYPIYVNKTDSDLMVTIYSSSFAKIQMMATIINYKDKFVYFQPEDYPNATFKETSEGFFYPSILRIYQKDFKEQCKNEDCYVLITAYNSADSPGVNKGKIDVIVQISQTLIILKEGSKVQRYLQQGSTAIFVYHNLKQKANLLFFTTSSNKDCLTLNLKSRSDDKGSNGSFLVTGDDEVQYENATIGWYQLRVIALDNCYFVTQVSSSQRPIKQLVIGYANTFEIQAGQKKHYFLHNKDLEQIRMIINLNLEHTGQLSIRIMPIKDTELSQLIKFFNDQQNKITNNKILYQWSDINHISLHSTDKRFCKQCYYFVEIEANKHIQGSINIPNSQSYSLHFNGYVSYDILDKGESFTWLIDGNAKDYALSIKLIAGSIQIQLQTDKKQPKEITIITFNASNPQQSIKTFYNFTQNYYYRHFTLKITALENSDYSVYSEKLSTDNKTNVVESFVLQEGRPNYLFLTQGKAKKCYQGKVGAQKQELILSDPTLGKLHVDNIFEIMSKKLIIQVKVDNIVVPIKKQNFSNVLLIQFMTNRRGNVDQNLSICFSWKSEEKEDFMANLMLLGNINYFPEHSEIHFRKSINLTFMSQGGGYIEIDQCATRSTVTLNEKLHDITNTNSNIRQMRVTNNLLYFRYSGSVYAHVETQDFVKLRWRNFHKETSNGFGYTIYSASNFRIRYEATTELFSLVIQPLILTEENALTKDHKGKIVSLTYHIYIAQQERQIYQAINCEKGLYMYWIKPVEAQNFSKNVQFTTNKLQDVLNLFGDKAEYLLITILAEANILWPKNNVTQTYRYYYPYQELLLTQFIKKQLSSEQSKSADSSYSVLEIIAVVILGIILILVIYGLFLLGKFMKNKYFRPQNFTEFDDLGSISMGKKGDKQMQQKSVSQQYAPPK